MLSPSRLLFGHDDEADKLLLGGDEKPGWAGGVLDLLNDSDDDQTDVPGEQSLEASLNESEEERRSTGRDSGCSFWPQEEGMRGPPPGFDPARPPPGLSALMGGGLGGLAVAPAQTGSGTCGLPSPMIGIRGSSMRHAAQSDDSGEDEAEGTLLDGSHMTGASSTMAGDGVWYSELPSIGSANHFNGTCDRCCFHPKGRCLNGYNCQHCHFDHEKRKRKNKKKTKGKGLSLDDGDMESSAGGSLPVSPDGSLAARTSLGLEDFVVPTAAAGFPEFGMAASSHGQTGELGVSDFAVQRPPQFESLEDQTPPEVVAYIRQLEEENRYLRGCLAQYTASAPPGPMPGQQLPELPHLPVGGQQVSELSAAATPFFPGAGQNWQEQHGGELCAAR